MKRIKSIVCKLSCCISKIDVDNQNSIDSKFDFTTKTSGELISNLALPASSNAQHNFKYKKDNDKCKHKHKKH